jgi:hypothetical protein
MRKTLGMLVLFCFVVSASWSVTAEFLVNHFEENQKWVQSSLVAYQVQKKASDERIADLYEFVSDKTYDYEGMIINGAKFAGKDAGQLSELMATIGQGVLAVIQKQATDDRKNLFKPTWLGYHTPSDKRVSNWFCLITGNRLNTFLTKVNQSAKLDEMGTDPLIMTVLKKELFDYSLLKDLGNRATLKITPKDNRTTNIRDAIVELAQLKIGDAEAWYVTEIAGTLTSGARGVTKFGNFRVAIAPVGKYIAYSSDNSLKSPVPIMDIGQALKANVGAADKIFVFATQIQNTSYQNTQDVRDYEVDFRTVVQRLHINPPIELVTHYLNKSRLNTLKKVAAKIVRNH